ncbi:MAG TPA: NUDIX domain-containing protein [candidate division Zixibacteria bacterium]|nr:NUDIX domain-containing protein [candidate division Zixibacteria bacterium]
MARDSAGLLVYRFRNGLEVFLVHPGGPFWANKDAGAWTIPKGEIREGEEPLAAARREFAEETGMAVEGEFIPLDPVRQSGGKRVFAWAVEGDIEAERVRSNTFSLEWPPRSGRYREFPEIDRAGWFALEEARKKILTGQLGLLRDLERKLGLSGPRRPR